MIVVERRISAKEGIILYKSGVSERIANGWIRFCGFAPLSEISSAYITRC
jgi:hypothetical protein